MGARAHSRRRQGRAIRRSRRSFRRTAEAFRRLGIVATGAQVQMAPAIAVFARATEKGDDR